MATQAEVRMTNERFIDMIDGGMYKQAIDAVNDFTRTKMREDGFSRKLVPPITITSDEFNRQLDTELLCKIVDKEPGSPAAMSIAFATLPQSIYIRGPRYRVTFCRLVTPRAQADVAHLVTWVMDIRQVISDNMIKDALAEEDSRWISAFNTLMLGPDVPVPYNGNVPQWETIDGGISRESLADALKIMNRGPSQLEAHTILVNTVFAKELMKWGRDEMGGDFSENVLRNGWSEATFLGKTWLITIKRNLVADNTMFMIADPKFVGKFYEWEPMTMYVEKRAFMLEFFSYETIGCGIGHSGGIARADFLGV